jgi:hypothetical protein
MSSVFEYNLESEAKLVIYRPRDNEEVIYLASTLFWSCCCFKLFESNFSVVLQGPKAITLNPSEDRQAVVFPRGNRDSAEAALLQSR